MTSLARRQSMAVCPECKGNRVTVGHRPEEHESSYDMRCLCCGLAWRSSGWPFVETTSDEMVERIGCASLHGPHRRGVE